MNLEEELRRLHDLLGKANALARIRAERVAELQAENEALRKSLRAMLNHFGAHEDSGNHADLEAARSAMKEKP